MVVSYFKDLFSEQRTSSLDSQRLESLITKKVSRMDWDCLIKPISKEEVKETIFMMAQDKAPGPDGYNVHFFRCAWEIIGKDVCIAVKDFFAIGRLLKSSNSTAISLVPKVENPSNLREFRPISCCNTLYKCVSKILVERLQKVLSYLVGKKQTTFIQDRRIADNIFVAQ